MEDVTGDELGRGYDAGRKTPPGDHSGGNVPRFDRQDANPGIPKPRPQAGKKRRETRLRRTVGVVRSPSAIPRHRAQPDEKAETARFESLRRLQKHGNQPSEITFYYLECRLGVPARAILIPEQPHSAQHRIRAGRQKPPQGGTRSRIERVERKDRRPTAVIRNFLKTLDIPSGKLHVVLGQDVKKGDLIAEIDSVPQLNQLETDKARLQSYESQLAAKKVALKIAKTKYDREMQLKKRDAASKESLEDAENAYALAKAEVTELESQIRQARIAVNTDEVNLGYTRITAPLDGTIVSVPVDEGQTVNANQTTPTIVQIADLDKMEIKIEISEGDITAVKPGMPITYTILSNPETEYKATLTSIDPGLTTLTDGSYKTTSSTGSSASSSSSSSSNNAVYYYGKALIDNKEGPLRIGMTTQNVITVADVKDALLVPVIAVQSRNGKKFVRVLGPGDKPERREVTTGIADGIHIQILSGLKEGDAVITAQVTQQERDAQVQQRHRGPRL